MVVHRNCCSPVQQSIDSQLCVQNRDLCPPYLHSTPPLGGSLSEYCRDVWCGKTRITWLPGAEKISKIRLLVLTEFTNVMDGQTNERTDTA